MSFSKKYTHLLLDNGFISQISNTISSATQKENSKNSKILGETRTCSPAKSGEEMEQKNIQKNSHLNVCFVSAKLLKGWEKMAIHFCYVHKVFVVPILSVPGQPPRFWAS